MDFWLSFYGFWIEIFDRYLIDCWLFFYAFGQVRKIAGHEQLVFRHWVFWVEYDSFRMFYQHLQPSTVEELWYVILCIQHTRV